MSPSRRFSDRLMPWLSRFGFMAGLLAVLHSMKEFYPFSHFPMYDSFEKETYYLYVARADGQPIPIQTLSGTDTTELKMQYYYKLRGEKDRRRKAGGKAGRFEDFPPELRQRFGTEILQWLEQTTLGAAKKAELGRLQLRRVDVFLQDGRITTRDSLLAEH